MAKHNYKRSVSAVMAVALVGATAFSMQRGADLKSGMEDEADAGMLAAGDSSLAEMRHFAIYNRYRMMFDNVPDAAPDQLQGSGGEISPAILTFGAMGTGSALPACLIGPIPGD